MSSIRSILERCSVGISGFVNIDGKVEDGIEVDQALKEIEELIDGVIGEDEHYEKSDPLYKMSGEPFSWAERNQLRAEQRRRIK